MCTWVAMQGNRAVSSQEQSSSQFVFLSPSAQFLWKVQDSAGSWYLSNEEGLLFRGPGPDFSKPNIEKELVVGFWSSLLFYFLLSLGTLPGPSHPPWDQTFKSSVSTDCSG